MSSLSKINSLCISLYLEILCLLHSPNIDLTCIIIILVVLYPLTMVFQSFILVAFFFFELWIIQGALHFYMNFRINMPTTAHAQDMKSFLCKVTKPIFYSYEEFCIFIWTYPTNVLVFVTYWSLNLRHCVSFQWPCITFTKPQNSS